ncbi:MAG: response regulator, partial [Candidatus Sulfotelmatobacter sp.]
MARKILLADDSVTAQNMGRKILADAGYEVIAVNNGSAALKKILELKPDLVILDVYMPGYSGLEVCQRLKESQETARIPVLLTVGKLEPFKPEEAQRVRAEGFIVKPFEASELLSTLSKLEDKVVPRAEPSKPGRFARAIAAAEETGRGGRNDANEDTGWKSRIGFPKPRTEAEETIADEPAIYNPVNRDLRTTVETAEEKAAGKTAKEGPRRRAGEAAETSVDVAALAPAGLPKDVTPEEVAAIAAAAAQMQMVSAAIKPEPQVSEIETTGTTSAASSEPVSDKVESNLPRSEVRGDSASTADGEVKTETPQRSGTESEIKKVAGAAEAVLPSREEISEETRDVPVTLAATAESAGSANPAAGRWTAVAVALEGEEAAISLHQEMQKAHTDVVAPEADPTGGVGVTQAAGAENSSAGAEAAMEVPAAAISTPEPEPVREPERAMGAAQPEAEAAPAQADPVARLEAATVASSGAVAEPASQG